VESVPLVVDLDGTLVRTDTLHESLLALLRNKPRDIFQLIGSLKAGRAQLKEELAKRSDLDLDTLPLNNELITWLHEQKSTGRRIVLATGANTSTAITIAKRVGVFDEIFSSHGEHNLTGPKKAMALKTRFGDRGFDYVGDSRKDVAVWQHARQAILVNATARVRNQAGEVSAVAQVFPSPIRGPRVWVRILRAHQWLKNLLLFTPFLAAHQTTSVKQLFQLGVAFVAFSICASAVYVANDLLDLDSDRRHARKRRRAFASGNVPLWVGALLAPILLVTGIALTALVNANFLQWLLVYVVITGTYSLGLKRIAIIDCIVLAMLYTLRVIAGAAASNTPLSFWLLAFSIFFFLSLAFVKRYAELQSHIVEGKDEAHGRGYTTSDAPIVQLLGVASGFAAVLILALYLDSTTVHSLYKSPQIVWGAVPVMLYWISWIWLKAHRGEMHDDPLVFAMREPESLIAGALFAAILIVGAVGWPW
jgi:4-hydroxybenzoate polyprenyltransferase/phosphoserine phosphatase